MEPSGDGLCAERFFAGRFHLGAAISHVTKQRPDGAIGMDMAQATRWLASWPRGA
jgi:hypothetical protein